MKIIRYPNHKLRELCQPVTAFDDSLRTLVADMTETMRAADGIGLAAIQVGVPLQLFILDEAAIGPCQTAACRDVCAGHATGGTRVRVFINPEIIEQSPRRQVDDEGCLSFPTIFVPVARHTLVRVRALNSDGAPFEIEAYDFYARAIQHERDHLVGKLLIDGVGAVKRDIILRKLAKPRK